MGCKQTCLIFAADGLLALLSFTLAPKAVHCTNILEKVVGEQRPGRAQSHR